MRKLTVLFLVFCLAGCSAQPVFETLADVPQAVPVGKAAQIYVELPEEAAQAVMENENAETLYFCDGYTVCLQTLSGGDIQESIKTLTGYDMPNLTVMETASGSGNRYECVWSSAGEGADQVGRLCLLDAGDWHYCLTLMAAEDAAGDLTAVWQQIVDSFTLE